MSALTNKHKLVAVASPESPRTEIYRTLRTNLEFAFSGGFNRQTLLFTSAKSGEGKTTTVSNLAVLYAQAGKKVLLLDANLRHPALHKVFNVSNRMGLTHLLTDNCTIEHAVQDLPVPKLSLVSAGSPTPFPSELLGSERMRTLLDELRGKFDITLIDAPPVLSYTDALVLSASCDGVIWVIRSGKVRQGEAREAMAKLEHVRAKVIGTVLNRG